MQGRKGRELVRDGWEWVGPGGRLHPEEFLERFYGHLIIEALLAVIIGYLFFQSSFKASRRSVKPLTEEVRTSRLIQSRSLGGHSVKIGHTIWT